MQQRLPSLLMPPIAFAHRGARAHAPENTLDAFALALRLGATGLESDVWLTADGVPVLDHDGMVGGRFRRRALRQLDSSERPEHVPSLLQLLETCGSGYHLSLDLKDRDAGPVVIELVRAEAPDLLPRLWLCDSTLATLTAVRPLDGNVKLVVSTRLARLKEGPERQAAVMAAASIDAINLHHTDWTGGLTTLFHRFDRYCLAWDVQHEPGLRTVLRMGIDGVYSDWVDRMVDAFAAET